MVLIRLQQNQNLTLPDGTYTGFWSGYNLLITNPDKNLAQNVATTIGIRGINVRYSIGIKNGIIYGELNK